MLRKPPLYTLQLPERDVPTAGALNTVRTFHASFCVPDSSDPARSGGIYIICEFSGMFWATGGP